MHTVITGVTIGASEGSSIEASFAIRQYGKVTIVV